MPACTLHLLSLTCPISRFLNHLVRDAKLKPIIVTKVHSWIITPSSTSSNLVCTEWHIVLLLEGRSGLLDSSINALVADEWSVKVGVPSRLLTDFVKRNSVLLNPAPGTVPPLPSALDKRHGGAPESSQNLELSDDLLEWINRFKNAEGARAVTMLNLLAFHDGMKDEYLKYGKAFAESIGSLRGGNAKLVGNVISPSSHKIADNPAAPKDWEWDEFAMAHYPSIVHFADMIASDDYQEVNHRHRLPSLKDTLIICTTDLELPSIQDRATKL